MEQYQPIVTGDRVRVVNDSHRYAGCEGEIVAAVFNTEPDEENLEYSVRFEFQEYQGKRPAKTCVKLKPEDIEPVDPKDKTSKYQNGDEVQYIQSNSELQGRVGTIRDTRPTSAGWMYSVQFPLEFGTRECQEKHLARYDEQLSQIPQQQRDTTSEWGSLIEVGDWVMYWNSSDDMIKTSPVVGVKLPLTEAHEKVYALADGARVFEGAIVEARGKYGKKPVNK